MTDNAYQWRRPFEVLAPVDAYLQVGVCEAPTENGIGSRQSPVFTHVTLSPGDEVDVLFDRNVRIIRPDGQGGEHTFNGRLSDPSDDDVPAANDEDPKALAQALEHEGYVAERAGFLHPSNPAEAKNLANHHLDPDTDTVLPDWPEECVADNVMGL